MNAKSDIKWPGEYDRERDEEGKRLTYDLTDLHFGIGALCINDMKETPMSVMKQGAEASKEIHDLRAENSDLRSAMQQIIERSENGELGTSKVLDMKSIALDALERTRP